MRSKSAIFSPTRQQGSASRAVLTAGKDGLYRWPLQYKRGSRIEDRGTRIKHAGFSILDPPSSIIDLKVGPPERLHSDSVRLFKSSPTGQTVGAILEGKGCAMLIEHAATEHKAQASASLGPIIKGLPGYSMSVSPDARWIATGHWNDRGIKVWDTRNQKSRELLSEWGGFDVCFSPDGRWLLASIVSNTEEYRSWAVDSWEPRLRLSRSFGGKVAGVMAFSPDGTMAAVETEPARLQLINPETGQSYATLEDPSGRTAYWANFTNDGTKLIVLDARTLHIWDLRLLRAQLAEYALDWDLPAYPPIERSLSTQRKQASLPQLQVDLSADFCADRGLQHAQHQEYDLAVADYQKALEIDPAILEHEARHAEACNNLAWHYVIGPARLRDSHTRSEHDALTSCLILAEKASAAPVQKDVTYWNYQNTLGVVYYRLGRWRDAVNTLQPAADATIRGASAAWDLFFLAMSYHQLGDHKMAHICYDKALSIENRANAFLKPDQRSELKDFRLEADAILSTRRQQGPDDK